MHTSVSQPVVPQMWMGKKRDEVDKGTNRETPGNSEGARPPEEEDFDKIHEQNQKEKKRRKE